MTAPAAAPLLEVQGLVVRYGRVTALRSIDIAVRRGEIVAIIGPNGAGKTSLLMAIAGDVRAASGRIVFDGKPIVGEPVEQIVRHGLAVVPEGRHVFGSLTVLENLRLGTTIRRDRQAIATELDSFFERFPILRERQHQLAGKLSGGEQQQLVIARALLSRPRLLMLDEPSLGLAPTIVDRVYELIEAIRADGVTVLVVEQNARRALRTADRTYVLNGGQVRLTGRSQDLASDAGFEAAYFGI
jgi:branched-chain amino acid transport system ATP-binding protein